MIYTRNNLFLVILLIAFLFMFSGCVTFTGGNEEWVTPQKPEIEKVVFKENIEMDLITLDQENAKKLAINIKKSNAYIKKLESLVDAMKKYYKAK